VTTFEEDIRAQADVLRRVGAAYSDPSEGPLAAARPWRANGAPVIFAGMGSSLLAARAAASRLVDGGRPALAAEAGELLHYGIAAIPSDALVVLVSQSGRSAETLALARRLHERGGTRLAAVVNDEASPLAQEATIVFPMLAGDESTVATKTFMATFIVVQAIADAITGRTDPFAHGASTWGIADHVAAIANDPGQVLDAAESLASAQSLVVVARGPALIAADYGALVLKETAAIAAEAMSGGSFRHGPMEIAGPSVGIIVLAPEGETGALCVRLAGDTSRLGSPTWLLASAAERPSKSNGALVSRFPQVPEEFAPILLSVALQLFAAELARRRGREPGVFLHSGKVTDVE
jgi:glucosamine--fructose-6-phosphate aminotransferase (isomerizing)